MALSAIIKAVQNGVPEELAAAAERAAIAKVVFAADSEGQRDIIENIRLSETEQELRQRLRVSTPVTGAAVAGPISYQARIARSPNRQELFEHPDRRLVERINADFERFYGGKTLYEYVFSMAARADNFYPNMWLVFEQSRQEGGHARVYPVQVPSSAVVSVERGLFGDIEALTYVRRLTAPMANSNALADYRHYYSYGIGRAAEAIELKPGAVIDLPEGGETITVQENGRPVQFYAVEYDTAIDICPAVQFRAYSDHTDPSGNTFELFYERALPILRKMANLGSVHDLLELMPPERYRYVRPCAHQNEQGEICEGGYYGGQRTDDKLCRSCHGTGRHLPSTEQQRVEILLREGIEPSEILPLSALAHDHAPPVELMRYIDERLRAFFRMVAALIFNQDLTDRVAMKTATEVQAAETTIENHLRLMAEAIEAVWEAAHTIALAYNQADVDAAEIGLSHSADLQLVPMEALIERLKVAKEAGASAAIVTALNRALLLMEYRTDYNLVASEQDFQRHVPFSGHEQNVALALVSGLRPDDHSRVLWERRAEIRDFVFDTLQEQGAYFSQFSFARQREIIATAVAEYTERYITPYLPAEPPVFLGGRPEDEEEEEE